MTEKDLRAIVHESLCLNKIIEIVGGGLLTPRQAAQDLLEAQMQAVSISRVVFNRDDFVEKEQPSEEEIKAYWDTHQDAYKTEEQRRINYILLTLLLRLRSNHHQLPCPPMLPRSRKKPTQRPSKPA